MLHRCLQIKLQRISEGDSPSKNSLDSPLNKDKSILNPCSMMESYMMLHRVQQQKSKLVPPDNSKSKQQIIRELQGQIVNKQIKINKIQNIIGNLFSHRLNGTNLTNLLVRMGRFCVMLSSSTSQGRRQTIQLVIKCCQWLRNTNKSDHKQLLQWLLKWIYTIFSLLVHKFIP